MYLVNQQESKYSSGYSRSYIKTEIALKAAPLYFISNFNSISIDECFYQLQLQKVLFKHSIYIKNYTEQHAF